jgi:hypothetical protein
MYKDDYRTSQRTYCVSNTNYSFMLYAVSSGKQLASIRRILMVSPSGYFGLVDLKDVEITLLRNVGDLLVHTP